MAVSMKNAVFWDVTPFGSCRNRRFEVTFHHSYYYYEEFSLLGCDVLWLLLQSTCERISELGTTLTVTSS
jgi:hypothetical protein